jgi:hypothetical protein
VRFREDNPGDLGRARAAVATWRDQNPAGTPEQLVAALGAGFHRDYGPVLRALLFAADRHRARAITGITGTAEAGQ